MRLAPLRDGSVTLLKGRLELPGRLCKMNRWTDLPGVQMFTYGSKVPRSYARAHPSYLHQGREHLYGMLRQERGHHRPLYLVSCAHAIRRCHSPLSGGRVESLRRGASGMDAARGVKGHGWPLYAGPRSDDGTREVERSETRMAGAKRFCLLFSRLKKVSRPAGRNQAPKQLGNRPLQKADNAPNSASPFPTHKKDAHPFR